MPDEKKDLSLWQVSKSVLSAFFGVQKDSVRIRDFRHGKPSQFIMIGLLLTAAFAIILWLVVQFILYMATS